MGKIEQENSELRDRSAELEAQLSAANQRVFLLEQRSGDFAKELSANEVELLRRALVDAQSESGRLTAELRVCRQELAVANVETEELRRELTALQDQLHITDGDRQNRVRHIPQTTLKRIVF
jgi:chromosome segregation ATPase